MNALIVAKTGGEATVGQVVEKNKQVCATVNIEQPFECLDLTYLSVLLTEAYGLDKDTTIDVSFHWHIWNFEFRMLKL